MPYVFLLAATATFFILSCGLPKTIFLSSPVFSLIGRNLLDLTHNIRNYDVTEGANQSFKGYEIYYRAYGSVSAAETAVGALQGYKASYESNPNQFMTAAGNLGFIRMRRATANTAPLVPVASADSAAGAQIFIPSYMDALDWTLTSTNPADSFAVYRNISDTARWGFYDTNNYLATDTADYSGVSNPSTIYFVFFAVAYGEDPEAIGQEVYSLPDDMTVSGNIISYP